MTVSSDGRIRAIAGSGLAPETRRVALVVSSVFFIEQLDTTIIVTAVPKIAEALGADLLHLNLAMSGYLLGLAIIIPVSGFLSDRFGARRVFVSAIGLFIFSSLLCGVASESRLFIAARFLQGVAGALMAPVGRLIVLRNASRAELVEAMALVMMPAFVAPLIGPALGGAIVTWWSWRVVFLVNIPIGLVAIPLVLAHLPADPARKSRSFDGVGALLVGVCFATAAMAFEAAVVGGVAVMLLLIGVAAALIILYILRARRHSAPIIDVTLLAQPNFRRAMAAGSIYRIAVGGVPFLLPLALQDGHGVSPLASGFILLIPALGGLVMKFFSTSLLRSYGFRSNLVVHGAISAVSLGAIAASRFEWPWCIIAGFLLGFGLSRSLMMNIYGTLAYADLPRERMADATSFFLAVQNLTTGMGFAFAALAARIAQAFDPSLQATTHYAIAFMALAACTCVSVLMTCAFARDAGAELIRSPS